MSNQSLGFYQFSTVSTVQRVLNWRKLFNVAIRMVLNQDLTDFILAKLILQSYLLRIKVLIHIFP